MAIATTPHLNFRGDARAALKFYHSVFGGQLVAVSYADAHAVTEPAEASQLLWGQVESPDGFRVMAYDVPSHTEYAPGVIPLFVSIRSTDASEIERYWGAFAAASTVVVPLAPAAWAPLYGMATDPFGVTWVFDVEVPWVG
ncbi:VOC family protein [Herbiconiux sp. VKM Ac-2851]|uniref:VOC family protein n=1 Tax=Herbiconiux sp. VKM Ac-2851 TaxID=2739025 RepID=UPI001567681A|nr:VOC family protein [Herbiconiux sp. VKM Ac-2851]NQX35073.1 VOC family protein [Herbiconiux sp. VKM Ac-2851]